MQAPDDALIPDEPWARRMHVGIARLDCDWPPSCGPRQFRGAVVAQMLAELEKRWHSDWIGRDPHTGECLHRPAPILYRTGQGRRPEVYAWGPRAHDHVRALARHLSALRAPDGRVYPVRQVEVLQRVERVQRCAKSWHRYELRSPVFPSDVTWKRRPREPGPERWAWAGDYLSACIQEVLELAGLELRGRLHVHLHAYRDRPGLEWARPQQGRRVVVHGFEARFVANALIPDGMGLGHHRAEGFGEVVRCDA